MGELDLLGRTVRGFHGRGPGRIVVFKPPPKTFRLGLAGAGGAGTGTFASTERGRRPVTLVNAAASITNFSASVRRILRRLGGVTRVSLLSSQSREVGSGDGDGGDDDNDSRFRLAVVAPSRPPLDFGGNCNDVAASYRTWSKSRSSSSSKGVGGVVRTPRATAVSAEAKAGAGAAVIAFIGGT